MAMKPARFERVLLFCLLGSGARNHDHAGDRTKGRDLGGGTHRMSFPPPAPGGAEGQGRPLLESPYAEEMPR
jgi:hypothetical protein